MSRQTEAIDADSQGASLVPVRTRRVVSAGGVRVSPPTVHCPRQQASIEADGCFACGRFTGVASAGGRAAIRCNAGLPTAPLVDDDAITGDASSVQDIMSRDVVCVMSDLPVESLARLLNDTGFGGVPVVDDTDVLIGMVSQTDVLGAEARAGRTVADIMMPIAFSMHEQVPIGALCSMMAFEGVHRIPVVDDDGRVIGQVSAIDVVRWVAAVTGHAVGPGPIAAGR